MWLLLALAHSGNPADAPILGPEAPGIVENERYEIRWRDADSRPITGTSTVNFFFSSTNPPTYYLGTIPEALTGERAAPGVAEEDLDNRLIWPLAGVPTGHYWLWSRIEEPPAELSPIYIRFSPSVVTVVHNDEDPGPAVTLASPAHEFTTADERFEIRYRTYDPAGTARVQIEATQRLDGTELHVVASELPASAQGVYGWDTHGLPEGDWLLRAVVEDCQGGRFEAWGRYFVLVNHAAEPPPFDAGFYDGGQGRWCNTPDSGIADVPMSTDAGIAQNDAGLVPQGPAEGCGCTTTHPSAILILLLGRRRRRPYFQNQTAL